MNLEFVLSKNGIGLTKNQLDECRSYAVAEILCRHHAEFEVARKRLIAQRLEWVKAAAGWR